MPAEKQELWMGVAGWERHEWDTVVGHQERNANCIGTPKLSCRLRKASDPKGSDDDKSFFHRSWASYFAKASLNAGDTVNAP